MADMRNGPYPTRCSLVVEIETEKWGNATTATEFVLLGLSTNFKVRAGLFVAFLVIYLIAVTGNGLILMLIIVDSHLHTPMYFFLSNLSFIDISYITTSVPQMLVHCFMDRPTIPLGRCFAQMSSALLLGVVECLLLAVMAYDRFVAICYPLRYNLIMSRNVCIQLSASVWVSGFLLIIIPFFTMQATLCGPNMVNHFKCELQAVLKVTCSDTHANGITLIITSVFTLALPFFFILVTYGRIGFTVLRIHSTQGRRKALSTCGSHLTVVSIYYGTLLAMYLRPQAKTFSNREKVVAVFYSLVIPMLNPIIYSLRNRDVKGAFCRLAGKKVEEPG
ncbi:olfactory receptor 13H1-like [Pseudonaja textilis]|uniref:olfactory receptor 13H1-like n=1 Tax=Pseudonaja textilis TaxID=8673 RepID=UPI000EA9F936|nr:olfactory receptor 13H1-like [Pseudonaja textilis]